MPRKTEEIGKKNDANKLRPSLLPWESLQAVIEVMAHGEKKYGSENWRSVDPQRYRDALARHVISYMSGDRYDDDADVPTICLIAANAMILISLDVVGPRKAFSW